MTKENLNPTPEQNQQPIIKPEEKSISAHTIFVLVLLTLVIIFAVINTQKVTVNLMFAKYETPLFFVIFISFALGCVTALFGSWNHRRKKAKAKK